MSWGYALKNGERVFINDLTGEIIDKKQACDRLDNLDKMVASFCEALRAAQYRVKQKPETTP